MGDQHKHQRSGFEHLASAAGEVPTSTKITPSTAKRCDQRVRRRRRPGWGIGLSLLGALAGGMLAWRWGLQTWEIALCCVASAVLGASLAYARIQQLLLVTLYQAPVFLLPLPLVAALSVYLDSLVHGLAATATLIAGGLVLRNLNPTLLFRHGAFIAVLVAGVLLLMGGQQGESGGGADGVVGDVIGSWFTDEQHLGGSRRE